jgi:hypothetical protein
MVDYERLISDMLPTALTSWYRIFSTLDSIMSHRATLGHIIIRFLIFITAVIGITRFSSTKGLHYLLFYT